MLYFQTWKVILILAACALGVIFSAPNLFSADMLASWPDFIPKRQVSLGLDLRGGSHLLLEVDMDSVERERLHGLVDEIRGALLDAKTGYTGLAIDGDHVAFSLREAGDLNALHDAILKLDPDLQVNLTSGGVSTVKFSDPAIQARRRSAVDQSIEIVRRRIDETGTKEPTIQREGTDRILVQLPGVGNPEHVKELLGRTAKMTFQLVDENVGGEDAARGRIPPGDVALPMENDRGGRGEAGSMGVKGAIMLSGERSP